MIAMTNTPDKFLKTLECTCACSEDSHGLQSELAFCPVPTLMLRNLRCGKR